MSEPKSTIQFGTKDAINNPTPEKLKFAMIVVQDFAVSVTGIVATTSVFNSRQSNVIAFILSVVYILSRAVMKGIGVVPTKIDS
jgi:hypothetical protein